MYTLHQGTNALVPCPTLPVRILKLTMVSSSDAFT